MLLRLEIDGLKSFAQPVTLDLAPLTLLTGTNSAGKSTVFQALLLVRNLMNGRVLDDGSQVLMGQDLPASRWRDWLARGHEEPVRISLETGGERHADVLEAYRRELAQADAADEALAEVRSLVDRGILRRDRLDVNLASSRESEVQTALQFVRLTSDSLNVRYSRYSGPGTPKGPVAEVFFREETRIQADLLPAAKARSAARAANLSPGYASHTPRPTHSLRAWGCRTNMRDRKQSVRDASWEFSALEGLLPCAVASSVGKLAEHALLSLLHEIFMILQDQAPGSAHSQTITSWRRRIGTALGSPVHFPFVQNPRDAALRLAVTLTGFEGYESGLRDILDEASQTRLVESCLSRAATEAPPRASGPLPETMRALDELEQRIPGAVAGVEFLRRLVSESGFGRGSVEESVVAISHLTAEELPLLQGFGFYEHSHTGDHLTPLLLEVPATAWEEWQEMAPEKDDFPLEMPKHPGAIRLVLGEVDLSFWDSDLSEQLLKPLGGAATFDEETSPLKLPVPTKFLEWDRGGLLSQAPPWEPIQQVLARIHRLGPLREEPQTTYSAEPPLRPVDIGPKGERAASVLRWYADHVVQCPVRATEGYRLEPRPLREAVIQWSKFIGLISSVEAESPDRSGQALRVQPDPDSSFVDLPHVGVGVSQALPILVLCLASSPGDLILLEQPELHLHPAVQSRLAEFFVACSTTGRQLLIETHSEHILNRLRLMAARSHLKPEQDLAIYFMERDRHGSTARRIGVDATGGIDDWPRGFFDEAEHVLGELLKQRFRN